MRVEDLLGGISQAVEHLTNRIRALETADPPSTADIVQVYDRNASNIDVNTTTETSIYSKAIAAGDLGTVRGMRLRIYGAILSNGSDTFVIRVKLGATTVIATPAAGLVTNDADRRGFYLEVFLANEGSASAQIVNLIAIFPDAGVTFTTGIGIASANNGATAGPTNIMGYNTAAVDTTAAQTLDVTWDWSATDAGSILEKRYAVLELV